MHVAARSRRSWRRKSSIRPIVDKEREILADAARKEGKPENIIDKMVEGRLRNFFGEKVLLEQPFVKDDKKTVGQIAKEAGMTDQAVRPLGTGEEYEVERTHRLAASMSPHEPTKFAHGIRDTAASCLKLSGESFATPASAASAWTRSSTSPGRRSRRRKRGVQIAIVIGGGNILRGAQFTAGNSSIQEATAHYMGMLATVINGLALQDALESLGLRDAAADGHPHGRRGRAVHPPPRPPASGKRADRASWPPAPAARSSRPTRPPPSGRWNWKPTSCSRPPASTAFISDDPEKNPHAVLYRELSYQAVREQNLRVMDPTAIAQCMEHDMPILVFNFKKEGNIERAVSGERVGTLIED